MSRNFDTLWKERQQMIAGVHKEQSKPRGGIMNQELKNDLITTHGEIQEAKLLLDYGDISAIRERLENALHWLRKYVTDEDQLVML